MEISLSFGHGLKNRKKELLFQYNNSPIISTYSFLYQRDGIALDVKYFKDLVAIYKKATRSFCIAEDYFAYTREYSYVNRDNYIAFRIPYRAYTESANNSNIFAIPRKTLGKVFETFFTCPMFKIHASKFENIIMHDKENKKGIILKDKLFIYMMSIDNRFKMSKLENIYVYSDSLRNKMNRFNPIFTSKNFKLNRFENFTLYNNQTIKHQYSNLKDILVSIPSNIVNYENTYNLHNANEFRLNINQNINNLLYNRDKTDKNMFYIDQDFLSKSYHDFSYFNNYTVYKNYPYLLHQIFDNINSEKEDKKLVYEHICYSYKNINTILNVFENSNAIHNNLSVYYADSTYMFNKNNMQMNLYEYYFANNEYNFIVSLYNHVNSYNKKQFTFDINDYCFAYSFNNNLYLYSQEYVSKVGKTLYIDDNQNLSIKNHRSYLNIFNHDFISKYKALTRENKNEFIDNIIKHVYNQEIYTWVNSIYKNVEMYKFNNIFTLNPKYTYVYINNDFFTKELHHIKKPNSFTFIHKLNKTVYKDHNNFNNITFFYLAKKDFKILAPGLFYIPKRKDVFDYNEFRYIHKFYHESISRDYSLYLYGKYYYINISDEINYFDKIYHKTGMNDNKHSFLSANSKISQSLYTFIRAEKEPKYAMYSNDMINFFKERYLTDSINKGSLSLIKSIYYADLFNTNQDFTVIFVNKNKKNVFQEKIINNITRLPKYSKSTYSLLAASKLNKNIYEDQDAPICDKLQRNSNYISLIQDSVIKHYIVTNFYNTNFPIYKVFKTSFANLIGERIFKKVIYSNSFQLDWFKKPLLLTYKDSIVDIHKKIRNVFDNKYEFINKFYIDIRIIPQHEKYTKTLKLANETYIDAIKIPKLVYFPNDEWIIKKYTNIEIRIQPEGISRKNKNISFHNEDDEFLYKFKSVWPAMTEEWLKRHSTFTTSMFDQYALDKTSELITSIFPEFNDIHKISHEVFIPVDEITDWAWVYDEDSPFVDPFKIDELLLPENDTRYEDFENIIFNRKTLKPRDPVKVIDKNTFIAKFPNHYPIKDNDGKNAYENVAIEYLDVRTSIMRKIFIGFYKVWQDNVFDFAKMTMQQSAKKILDYLYTWILMQFALEDIPEALRVFRLIRWYLECCIIETSEYIVSYEADNLTSGKLNTTKLDIPNDMFPDQKYAGDTPIEQNATMFIDTNKHVIRNNPSLLHTSDAHVTFYIENSFETTISFSLHTLTPVSIILNGKTIDTITLPTSSKMVYNIPYTDSFNTFTIYKNKFDNNDTEFFIGNIVIVGMGHTGELDIKFNPIINGNKVLNNTSQKLISYMNLYEDNEELMHELVKGNVHLDVAYDKICQYWELHHQHKDKGKRLTIKRT